MTDTLIKRMALAMAEVLTPYQQYAAVGELEGTTFAYIDVGPLDMMDFALAALKSIREPTESMLDAGAEASAFVENGWELLRPWQAMIDQAIKEGK